MKYIYILLTRPCSHTGAAIRFFSGDDYSHASLSLDRSLTQLYSFARKHRYFPLIGGFVHEDINTGIFALSKYSPCRLYALPVSDAAYRRIRARIDEMRENRSDYRYNLIGLPLYLLRIPYRRRHHFTCSQFVAELLDSTSAALCPIAPSLMRPESFLELKNAELVYSGALGKCC